MRHISTVIADVLDQMTEPDPLQRALNDLRSAVTALSYARAKARAEPLELVRRREVRDAEAAFEAALDRLVTLVRGEAA